MQLWQEKQRRKLYSLLGDLPSRDSRMGVRTVGIIRETEESTVEKLALEINDLEPVPAYFLKPKSRSGTVPAVLYNHYHGGQYHLGKEEMFQAREGSPCWAEEIIKLGYCALCIDAFCFGERASRKELELFKEMLWKGKCLWGMMVFDSLRAFDYLLSRPEVDRSRVLTLGMSMGSTMAWWVAALEPRIKVCAEICCLTDFQALIDTHGLNEHSIYYYVPSLLKHFSTAQINALIAPRAHIAVAGNLDPLTPTIGLDRIDIELKETYARFGMPENWKLVRYDTGHNETPEMRREILAFLRERV